ncbi:MAG: HAMP domain-containing histidine kinase [Lachnospiraceae bacterium]|nr:HAMP domain-containing histidine kinase [Lachnospiraceae bacterium]MDE6982169.1 HAMP domain-containing histidine kinase [Lachnospiraceae bacterium]
MGRQKQNSIVKYVANYFFALLMLLAFVMLCFVVFLSKQLTYSSIRREMSIELRQNAKYMHVKDDGYVLDEEFLFQDSEYIFVILDDKGKLLQGVYPQNFPADLEVNSGKLRTIKVNGIDYYFQDRQSLHSPLAIRCVIEQSKADSDYDKFVYLTWGFVLFILGISVGMWKLLERREMRQINQVVEMVGKIGREKSLSRRIEYNGRFAEIVSLVQANNRMLGQLQEMFETQKRFTSDVAHELRTPITVLMAECEYAGQKIQKEGEVWEAFQVIERQISKMNCIIVQMLNLSRLDQDKMKLNREWIDLGEIVDSVCDDISFQDTKQVEFIINIAPEFNVYADIGLMTILIQNLLDNAVKYGPDGGRVWIWSQETREEYLLHIKDEGKGISKENQEKIFQRFFRVEKSELIEGFGLGLSMVKRIAEKHNGSVTVESALGRGSTFTLHLPRHVEGDGD